MREKIGDYVFATKWADGDPGDPWALGFLSEIIRREPVSSDRYIVADGNGKSIYHNGFRHVKKIRPDVGAWLLSVGKQLEKCPAGTVNMWTMLTPNAFACEGEELESESEKLESEEGLE